MRKKNTEIALNESTEAVWAGFIWIGIGTSNKLFWIRNELSGFTEGRGISWRAERLLAFAENCGRCGFMALPQLLRLIRLVGRRKPCTVCPITERTEFVSLLLLGSPPHRSELRMFLLWPQKWLKNSVILSVTTQVPLHVFVVLLKASCRWILHASTSLSA
jgi:hypothetical protein